MLRSSSGKLVLSATDLTNHLGCLHLTHERRRIALGLRGKPAPVDDAHSQLVRERGQKHEADRLAQLAAEAGGSYADLTGHEGWTVEALERAAAATVEAMRDGHKLIYQATFFDGRWQGRTDFLRRVEQPSRLGAHAYEVLDTKLARQVKPGVVHQLCLYNRLLAAVQGYESEYAYVVLGNDEEVRVELRRYRALHRHTARRLERVVDGDPEPVYPEPVAHCGICQLDAECSTRRRRDDHLSLVAFASRDARAKLVGAAIATVADLADARADSEVADLPHERFELLHEQAKLQVESRTTHQPTRRHLPPAAERGYARLPAPSPGDIFFDLEGDPYVGNDGGIEYLWGWTTADGSYHCRWAHTDTEERTALREFIDFVERARRHHPDLHVFHYAPHEKSKLRSLAQKYGVLETVVDDWLRTDLLVDLYAVVRQGLQVGEESYSLKRLERHHAFERKEHSVREGGGSIIAYEGWLETGDEKLLEAIRAYNQEDCASTASLFAWLVREMRPEAAQQYGVDFEALPLPADEEIHDGPTWLPEMLELIERLSDGLPAAAEEDDSGQAARRVLAGLLLYHYRESKPQFWEWFDLKAKTPEELVGEREAVGLLELDTSVEPVIFKQSLEWTYRFPAQETKLSPGQVLDPATGQTHTLVRIDDERLVLRRGKNSKALDPTALIGCAPPDGRPMRMALRIVAESLLAGEDRYHAALALLRREPPSLPSSELGPETEKLIAATLGLQRSVLPVQGPPGTGKTYRGARMVVAALQAGQRVAVCAQSHAAIQNLLHMIESSAAEEKYVFSGVYKGDGYESAHGLVKQVGDNPATYDDDYNLVAGTSWLLSCEGHREQFGTLFIDEAGQFSLAVCGRHRPLRAQRRAARRPAATAAGQPGSAPRRRRRVRARAPAGRRRRRAGRPRRAARRELAHAPRRLRVRLGAQLRRQAALTRGLRPAAHRRPGRHHGRRPPHPRGRALRAEPGLARGGRGDRRRVPHAAGGRQRDGRAGHHAPARAGRSDGRRALQSRGRAHPARRARRRLRRHGRHVPGPRGAPRLLCHDLLVRRGRPTRPRLPLQPQPLQRRDLPRAVHRHPRALPAAARFRLQDARADGLDRRRLQLRRARDDDRTRPGCPRAGRPRGVSHDSAGP